MAGYIILQKFTQEGLKHIDTLVEAAKTAPERLAEHGIKVVGIWFTMGEYDVVTIVDAEDELTLSARVLNAAKGGDLTTTTMRAFSEEEFAGIVAKLP